MTELGNIMNNLDMSLSSQKNTGNRHLLSLTHPKNSSLVPLNGSQGSANTCDPLYQHLVLLLPGFSSEWRGEKMCASRVEEDVSQGKVFLQVFIYLHQELGMFSHLHWDKTSLTLLSYRNYP